MRAENNPYTWVRIRSGNIGDYGQGRTLELKISNRN
jgi:hypothetical protein